MLKMIKSYFLKKLRCVRFTPRCIFSAILCLTRWRCIFLSLTKVAFPWISSPANVHLFPRCIIICEDRPTDMVSSVYSNIGGFNKVQNARKPLPLNDRNVWLAIILSCDNAVHTICNLYSYALNFHPCGMYTKLERFL